MSSEKHLILDIVREVKLKMIKFRKIYLEEKKELEKCLELKP